MARNPYNEPLGSYPTVESVGLEIFTSILVKIMQASNADGAYLSLWDNDVVIKVGVTLTDEELDVLRRLAAAIDQGLHIDGSTEGAER